MLTAHRFTPGMRHLDTHLLWRNHLWSDLTSPPHTQIKHTHRWNKWNQWFLPKRKNFMFIVWQMYRKVQIIKNVSECLTKFIKFFLTLSGCLRKFSPPSCPCSCFYTIVYLLLQICSLLLLSSLFLLRSPCLRYRCATYSSSSVSVPFLTFYCFIPFIALRRLAHSV